MTSETDPRELERRLAEAFPEWVCVAVAPDPTVDQRAAHCTVACRRRLSAQPVEDDDDDGGVLFSGASWEAAFRAATEGLRPGDQGDPTGR